MVGEKGLEPLLPCENQILSLARLPVPPLARSLIIPYFFDLCYNRIMDSEKSGQSSTDAQRQTAAEIARKKVLAAYANTAQKSEQNADDAHLKNSPESLKMSPEDWKKYHSEWQNYYQKYYNEYYSKAAHNYIAKEKLKQERAKAEDDEIEEELRRKIRKKATDNAKKSRRRRKFIPILAGLTVVLLVLFLQYNRLIFTPIMAYMSPGEAPANQIEAIDPTVTQAVSAEPRLIIPKLNIDVPVHFGISLDEVMSAMNNGVAHYRISGASAFPGEVGNTVITGHSAGDVYSSNPYKYIFSGLERLENGDLIYINYNSVRYTYSVTKEEVVEPSNVDSLRVATNKPILTLVTCTPLGTSRYRLLVTAEQISPDYEKKETADQEITAEQSESLPSNEPSFFEGIWNWLTGK
jgi:sortase A